ncbi:MAG: hypothetical protein ABI460_03560 [Caldimonas sp.]
MDSDSYAAIIATLHAAKDLDPAVHKPGGIGRIEQWRTPEGRICAWLQVDYWRGEHDFHFFVDAELAPPPA